MGMYIGALLLNTQQKRTNMSEPTNDNLVLLCGKSATGKSASFMELNNPEGVVYANCEAG
jgi:hypothetical protein